MLMKAVIFISTSKPKFPYLVVIWARVAKALIAKLIAAQAPTAALYLSPRQPLLPSTSRAASSFSK